MKSSDQTTCLDPYLASFEESLSSRNYKPETLTNYRSGFRTPECQDHPRALAAGVRKPAQRRKCPSLDYSITSSA